MNNAKSINLPSNLLSKKAVQQNKNTPNDNNQRFQFQQNDIIEDDEYSDPSFDEEEEINDFSQFTHKIIPTAIEESRQLVLPSDSFHHTQKEITIALRLSIIDWLLRIVLKLNYQRNTLYNAVWILDRILSKVSVSSEDLQLTSIVCLWMTAKVEAISSMSSIQEFLTICNNRFTSDQFRKKELQVFQLIDGRLNYPTSQLFLHPLLNGIECESYNQKVQFFLDMSLMEYELISYPSPLVTVGAIATVLGDRCPLLRLFSLISTDMTSDVLEIIRKITDITCYTLENKNTAMYTVFDEEWLQEMKEIAQKSLQYFINYFNE